MLQADKKINYFGKWGREAVDYLLRTL